MRGRLSWRPLSLIPNCYDVFGFGLVISFRTAAIATPAKALGVADKAWTIGQLVDAALAVAPALPTETPPDRRRKFMAIEGGKNCISRFGANRFLIRRLREITGTSAKIGCPASRDYINSHLP
jgi:hypothetical protein